MNRRDISRIALLILACVVAACGPEPETDTGTDGPPLPPAASSQSPTEQAATLAGVYQLSGFVFEDKNRNGRYDTADVRLAQQTVVLTDSSDSQQIQSVTTGADGSFRVENLAAGEYRLTLRIPDGFERTLDDSFVFTVGPEGGIPEVQFGIAAR